MKNTRRFAVLAALSISAIAAQAAGFDYADNSSYPPEVKTQSTLTRAQVTADLDFVSTSAGLTRGMSCSIRQKM